MTSVLAATYTTCNFPESDKQMFRSICSLLFSLCYKLLEFPEYDQGSRNGLYVTGLTS